MNVLEVRDATRRFVTPGEVVTALEDVSLTLAPGELVGLAGPSGSGKTTLAHAVLGWEQLDSGTIDVRTGARRGFAGVGIVPQELGMVASLTLRQNVDVARRLGTSEGARPGAAADRDPAHAGEVDDLLARLEVHELGHRLPHQVSLGEQQRAAVARAVVCRPRLVVADEPTAHQDERRGVLVVDVLAEVAAAGGAVLVASHDPRVLRHTDRVVTLEDGRVVDVAS